MRSKIVSTKQVKLVIKKTLRENWFGAFSTLVCCIVLLWWGTPSLISKIFLSVIILLQILLELVLKLQVAMLEAER